MQTKGSDVSAQHRQLWIPVCTLADAVVLVRLLPNWSGLSAELADPRTWVGQAGPDSAALSLVSALLWLTGLWLAIALLVAAGSVVPGRVGRIAGSVSEVLMPAALRRVIIGTAGACMALSPASAIAVATASPAAPATATTTATATAAVMAPAIGWPTDSAPVAWPSSSSSSESVPLRTAAQNGTTRTPSAGVPGANRSSAILRGPASPPAPTPPGPPNGGDVSVARGDSLWLIAAHRLGPNATDHQIAAEWPLWYAANRQVIGADPDLLIPGQHLAAPLAPTTIARD